MSAPIRILRIINSLEPYGVELGIVDMCRRLTEGYQWAVLSFMGGAVADKLRECGVEVFGPNESRDNSPSMFAMFREVRRAVDSWRPHIVHGHLDRGSILLVARGGLPFRWIEGGAEVSGRCLQRREFLVLVARDEAA